MRRVVIFCEVCTDTPSTWYEPLYFKKLKGQIT